MIQGREAGIECSPKAVIGYFDQIGYKMDRSVSRDDNVIAYMQEACDYPVSDIRAVLAAMGFTQLDVRKPLAVLSGGEMIKLQLARMLLGRYNVLLMDEPSSFLDLPAVEALETMMQQYTGTIVFITHDARLIDNVADQVYALQDGRLVRKR